MSGRPHLGGRSPYRLAGIITVPIRQYCNAGFVGEPDGPTRSSPHGGGGGEAHLRAGSRRSWGAPQRGQAGSGMSHRRTGIVVVPASRIVATPASSPTSSSPRPQPWPRQSPDWRKRHAVIAVASAEREGRKLTYVRVAEELVEPVLTPWEASTYCKQHPVLDVDTQDGDTSHTWTVGVVYGLYGGGAGRPIEQCPFRA